jgi:hypothetical protein
MVAGRRVAGRRSGYRRHVSWMRLLRTLPPWRQAVYWLASIAALALVIWDIVDEDAHYTSIAVLALVVVATIALRAPDRRGGA